MNEMEVATILLSLVALLGLTWLVFAVFPELLLDEYRQGVFALRDELFDYAASGAIAFDDRSYGLLRSTMNGLIRYAHRMTLPRMYLTLRIGRPVQANFPPFHTRFTEATNDLSPANRKALHDFCRRMDVLNLKFILLGSPISLMTIVIPAAYYFAIRHAAVWLARFFRAQVEMADSAVSAFDQQLC
jgi:hypothetical protein